MPPLLQRENSVFIIYKQEILHLGSRLSSLSRNQLDILDYDLRAKIRSKSDPSSLGASTAVSNEGKEVVNVTSSGLPCVPAIARDLELGSVEPRVDDGSSEPVL
ncbi:hypothetical protein GGP41_003210 [Bipolaris sorokiniana]|uniref:Uncharacterized protein n=1 Tax=Cochliobolus sativus TaxID=45130 RepID=A0A8H6DSY8_COCSA|nr:hypothetical protein GGP41_003210 [Bipolaris sorokiniana]